MEIAETTWNICQMKREIKATQNCAIHLALLTIEILGFFKESFVLNSRKCSRHIARPINAEIDLISLWRKNIFFFEFPLAYEISVRHYFRRSGSFCVINLTNVALAGAWQSSRTRGNPNKIFHGVFLLLLFSQQWLTQGLWGGRN